MQKLGLVDLPKIELFYFDQVLHPDFDVSNVENGINEKKLDKNDKKKGKEKGKANDNKSKDNEIIILDDLTQSNPNNPNISGFCPKPPTIPYGLLVHFSNPNGVANSL